MSNKIQYTQCFLRRVEGTKHTETVSWLPTRIKSASGMIPLVAGGVVDLKQEDGSWERGWIVVSTGPIVDEAPNWRAQIKGHRNQTGDNLPKGG